MSAARYPASRSFVMSSSVMEEAIQFLSCSGRAQNDFAEKVKYWALGLERERMDEQRKKKSWVKKGNPCVFTKAVETMRLPTCPINSLIPQAPC